MLASRPDPSSPVRLPAWAVFVASAGVFAWFCGASPGFRDAGELGAAAQVLGVAHPTGFPLDMLLYRLGGLLPFGTVGYRQNLVAALLSAGALGVLAALVRQLGRRGAPVPETATAVGILVAVVGLASWDTFAQTTLSVEVYPAALLLALLALKSVVGMGALREPHVEDAEDGSSVATPQGPGPSGAAAFRTSAWLTGLMFSAHVVARLHGLLCVGFGLVSFSSGRSRARAVLSAGVLLSLGAALNVYLPLASLRQPPIDWGDPETLTRLWEHLSAARIRTAYADSMLGGTSGWLLFEQLAELWPVLPFTVLGAWALARRHRSVATLLAALLLVDLAYALLVNPMGIRDRQVGQLSGALIALLAGVGAARLVDACLGCAARSAAALRLSALALCVGLALGFAAWSVTRSDGSQGQERYAADEWMGAGGALASAPPRAVLVCETDDTCAVLWFARHAEGARPDTAIVPAQHLWEPTVRAPLRDLVAPVDPSFRPERPAARAMLSQHVLARLIANGPARPVLVERRMRLDQPTVPQPTVPQRAVPQPTMVAADGPPWWQVRGAEARPSSQRALQRFERMFAARASDPILRQRLAREAWSRSFGEVGKAALAAQTPRTALRAFQRATEIAPERAVAWSNLGVVQAQLGDLRAALYSTQLAVECDPHRVAAWANLVRYRAAAGDVVGARGALTQARALGLNDPRLHALERQLSQ